MDTWLSACKEFGVIGGLLLVVLGVLSTLLIKHQMWILGQFKIELENSRKERTDYLLALTTISKQLDEHSVRSKEFQCNVAIEHKEMIKNLGEITITLGRINGYKQH